MPTCESIGGMAKTAGDLQELIKIILQAAKSPVDLPAETNRTWQDFALGFVDPSLWRLPAEGFTATEDYCNQIVSLKSSSLYHGYIRYSRELNFISIVGELQGSHGYN